MKLVILAAVVGVLSISTAQAESSSFQRSCKDININATQANVYLVATCGDGKGGWNRSRIELYGIENIDGRLTQFLVNMGGPSTFQRSCTGARVVATQERAVLIADCRRRDQTVVRGRVELLNIENIFGQLKFR